MEILIRRKITAGEVETGVAVFSELGFCAVSGWGDDRVVRMAPTPARMELARSVCYAEGLRARAAFEEFSAWALGSAAEALLARVNRPITPDFGIIVREGKESPHAQQR